MKTISTLKGEVNLLEPSGQLLRGIRRYLPFGAIRLSPPNGAADYGIVMQCGEKELFAIKQQPPDCGEESCYAYLEANSVLIALAISKYLQGGFSGLFMPCAYMRKKDEGRFESGIAYFCFPSPEGRESLEFPDETAWGVGFTPMLSNFIRALKNASAETRIPLYRTIGLEYRYRLQLGTLLFGFMVVGPHVFCLKTNIDPDRDPVWAALRSTGITEVFHLPSIPVAIDETDLPTAKPS